MNYANIKYCDIANGPGVRTTLFVSGCRLHCPNCFNEEAWDFEAGEPFTDEVAAQIMDSMDVPYVGGLTILGGEPMEPENQQGLVGFLEAVRERFGSEKSIWLFSGHTWDQLACDRPPARHAGRARGRTFCARPPRHHAALPRLLQPAPHRRPRHARGAGRRRCLVGGRAALLHTHDGVAPEPSRHDPRVGLN